MQKCDTSKSGYLAGGEIEHFYDLLTHREEIDVIYGEYAKTTSCMSPENLVEFLMKEQREKATLADAHAIIEKYEPDEHGQYSETEMQCFLVSRCYSAVWRSGGSRPWSLSTTALQGFSHQGLILCGGFHVECSIAAGRTGNQRVSSIYLLYFVSFMF